MPRKRRGRKRRTPRVGKIHTGPRGGKYYLRCKKGGKAKKRYIGSSGKCGTGGRRGKG